MVLKKKLKTKVPAREIKKINNLFMSNCKNKKNETIYVSQNVVISSIFDKSLIDKSTKAVLPENICDIYKEMMSDVAYINATLSKKDYSFYGCNMTFLDGEAMVSEKRRGLVEFMTKRRNVVSESDVLKKKTLMRKSMKKSSKRKKLCKNSMDPCDPADVKKKFEKEHADLNKEMKLISDENTELSRSQRKRKAPSKFKRENSCQPKSKSNLKHDNAIKEEEVNSGTDDNIELRIVLKKPAKTAKLKKKSKEIINLVAEDSSDGDSDNQRPSKAHGNCDKALSGKSDQKSKVYFREPLTRKPTKLSNKKLKEHTLLDKILLGINCVRKWTERGLHLSRLCETDLVMLNKRLTSLNCVLSDLEEHTDENRNRYLSVLLQSDLFSAFIVSDPSSLQTPVSVAPCPQKPDNECKPTTVKEQNDQPQLDPDHNNNNVNYSRQKSKLHVPVMYRQRHGVPSILSKPAAIRPQINDQKSTPRELSSMNSYNGEDNSFSIIKLEEKFQVSHSGIQTETAPTASQLLRLKFQKSNLDQANQNNTAQIVSDVSNATSKNSHGTQLSQYTIPNGIALNSTHSFIVQTANQPIPLIVLPPNSTLMPQMSNGNRRPIHIPFSKPFHTVTKIQRIPLNGSGIRHLTTNPNQIRITSANERNNNLSSKSVILKNLLQQSSTRFKSSQVAVSTNQMVPRSVFQSSQPKRPFVSFNHHQSLNR